MDSVQFNKILQEVLSVPDLWWHKLAFKNDFMWDKIAKLDCAKLIQDSVQCGIEQANIIWGQTNSNNPKKISEHFGIDLSFDKSEQGGGVLTFATFTTPKKIVIYTDVIEKACKAVDSKVQQSLSVGEDQSVIVQTFEKMLTKLLFAHELFHYIETSNKKTIFTQQTQITLWNLFGFKYKSTMRCLSEVAASAFAKTLCKTTFCPNILDIMLVYSYSPDTSQNIYNKLIATRDNI